MKFQDPLIQDMELSFRQTGVMTYRTIIENLNIIQTELNFNYKIHIDEVKFKQDNSFYFVGCFELIYYEPIDKNETYKCYEKLNVGKSLIGLFDNPDHLEHNETHYWYVEQVDAIELVDTNFEKEFPKEAFDLLERFKEFINFISSNPYLSKEDIIFG